MCLKKKRFLHISLHVLCVFSILFFHSLRSCWHGETQDARVCPCTNTPGDSNNNAAVLGSFRAARAVRPFVSRGHSLHYNPRNKAPSGACARPRRRRRHCSSLHECLSAFARRQETHSSEFKKKKTKIKSPQQWEDVREWRGSPGDGRMTRGRREEENGNGAGPWIKAVIFVKVIITVPAGSSAGREAEITNTKIPFWFCLFRTEWRRKEGGRGGGGGGRRSWCWWRRGRGRRVFLRRVWLWRVLFGSTAGASNTSHTLSGSKVATRKCCDKWDAHDESAGVGANWNKEVKVPRQEGASVCVVCVAAAKWKCLDVCQRALACLYFESVGVEESD